MIIGHKTSFVSKKLYQSPVKQRDFDFVQSKVLSEDPKNERKSEWGG
jgi:hypothetical protein